MHVAKSQVLLAFAALIPSAAGLEEVCVEVQRGTLEGDSFRAVAITDSLAFSCGYTETSWEGAEGSNQGGADFLVASQSLRTGAQIWARQVGTSTRDACSDISVTRSGGVVAVGETSGSLWATNSPPAGGGSSVPLLDGLVLVLDSDGEVVWSEQIHTEVIDSATGVTVLSPSGDVVIVGYTTGSAPDCQPSICQWQGGSQLGDVWASRQDALTGEVVWRVQLGTSAEDAPTGVVANGNDIYIAGHTSGDLSSATGTSGGSRGGNYDPFVCKLDASTGGVAWCFQHGSDKADYARSVALDDSGDVVVCGDTTGSMDTGLVNAGGVSGTKDWYCMKVAAGDSAPSELSAIVQDGTAADEVAHGVAYSDDGGGGVVMVVGSTRGNLYGQIPNPLWSDAFVAELDPGTFEILSETQVSSSQTEVAWGVGARGSTVVWVGDTTGELVSDEKSNAEVDEDALFFVGVSQGSCSDIEEDGSGAAPLLTPGRRTIHYYLSLLSFSLILQLCAVM